MMQRKYAFYVLPSEVCELTVYYGKEGSVQGSNLTVFEWSSHDWEK